MALAGLWTSIESEHGKVDSYVIVTTQASQHIAHIHDRMPLIIDDDKIEARGEKCERRSHFRLCGDENKDSRLGGVAKTASWQDVSFKTFYNIRDDKNKSEH